MEWKDDGGFWSWEHWSWRWERRGRFDRKFHFILTKFEIFLTYFTWPQHPTLNQNREFSFYSSLFTLSLYQHNTQFYDMELNLMLLTMLYSIIVKIEDRYTFKFPYDCQLNQCYLKWRMRKEPKANRRGKYWQSKIKLFAWQCNNIIELTSVQYQHQKIYLKWDKILFFDLYMRFKFTGQWILHVKIDEIFFKSIFILRHRRWQYLSFILISPRKNTKNHHI